MKKNACLIAVLTLVAGLARCSEITVKHDYYACDLGAENACPPGMVCVEVPGGDESRCLYESCLPWECAGCCGGEGTCLDGNQDTACGTGGAVCLDCDSQGLACRGGRCTNPGCTDQDGDGFLAGVDCPAELIDDCDDNAPGITGPCQENGCPQGWVFIDKGAFMMGCNEGEIDPCPADERPSRTVRLAAYCIQLTEVSVAQYRACHDTAPGICPGPMRTSESADCNFENEPSDRENHPINCLTRSNAQAFCQSWLGGDLPSEAQWEKAARGIDQRLYPWGSEGPDCTRCNWNYSGSGAPYGCSDVPEDGGPMTWEVGHITGAAGDSFYRLKDMAGNVWEFVLDCYEETGYPACDPICIDPVVTDCTNPDRFVVRGGSFYESYVSCFRTYERARLEDPEGVASNLGFRCVRIP